MANQLQGPNYQIDSVMPSSLRNTAGALPPNPEDRIHIYEIISTATSFTLTDGASSHSVTLLAPAAAGSWTFNPPLAVFDFQITAIVGGVVDIFSK